MDIEETKADRSPDQGGSAPRPHDLARTHQSIRRSPLVVASAAAAADDLVDGMEGLGNPSRHDVGPISGAGLPTSGLESYVLGNFQILRKIGSGAFGAVYRARQLSTERDLALKVLDPVYANRADFRVRFYREAETLSKLAHPNIVRGFPPTEADGFHFFAMEYVDGDNMQTWLRRLRRLSVGDALHIALHVATALQYAHERNLVHRDIKPENILLTQDGMVKVADLGLAKAMNEEDLSLTRTGTGFGTPYYMAPEQARNAKHVDHRSDIYALGSTLFHLLAGQLPYKAETAMELVLAKEKDPQPEIRKSNRNVPERVDMIVGKMMAKNQVHRYQSCADLIADLDRLKLANARLSFLNNQGECTDPQPTPPPSFAQTQAINVVMAVAPAETWWHVRYKTTQGEVVKRMTTRQLQERIKDPAFDLKAEVSTKDGGPYEPLMRFAEFQPSVLIRQSQSTRVDTGKRSARLQKMYDEVQTDLAAAEERRRAIEDEDDEEDIDVRQYLERSPVAGWLESLKAWMQGKLGR